MHDIYISGTGVWTPPHKVSNKELVESFNEYVRLYNIENEQRILDGSVTALERHAQHRSSLKSWCQCCWQLS